MKPLVLLKTFILVYFALFPIAYLVNDVRMYVAPVVNIALASLLLSVSEVGVPRRAKTFLRVFISCIMISSIRYIYYINCQKDLDSSDLSLILSFNSLLGMFATNCFWAAILLSNLDMRLKGLCVLKWIIAVLPFGTFFEGMDKDLVLYGSCVYRVLYLVAAFFICKSWHEIVPSEVAFTESRYRKIFSWFLPYGSITRKEYVEKCLIGFFIVVFIMGLFGISTTIISNVNASIVLTSLLGSFLSFVIWFLIAQGARRCHDLGRSGWMQFVPFYNLVLLFKE